MRTAKFKNFTKLWRLTALQYEADMTLITLQTQIIAQGYL